MRLVLPAKIKDPLWPGNPQVIINRHDHRIGQRACIESDPLVLLNPTVDIKREWKDRLTKRWHASRNQPRVSLLSRQLPEFLGVANRILLVPSCLRIRAE